MSASLGSGGVIQLSRKKGWRKPEGAVVVARPSKWGNPFDHDGDAVPLIDGSLVMVRNREDAANLFGHWLDGAIIPADPELAERQDWMLDHLHELTGKALACWCPQPGPCHAHVLAALARVEGAEP